MEEFFPSLLKSGFMVHINHSQSILVSFASSSQFSSTNEFFKQPILRCYSDSKQWKKHNPYCLFGFRYLQQKESIQEILNYYPQWRNKLINSNLTHRFQDPQEFEKDAYWQAQIREITKKTQQGNNNNKLSYRSDFNMSLLLLEQGVFHWNRHQITLSNPNYLEDQLSQSLEQQSEVYKIVSN